MILAILLSRLLLCEPPTEAPTPYVDYERSFGDWHHSGW